MGKTGRINTPALYRRNKSGISISSKTGRITITKKLIRHLNMPDYIKIIFEDDGIIIRRGTEKDLPVYYGKTYQAINRKHIGLYILYEYTRSYDLDGTIPFRKVEWYCDNNGNYIKVDMSNSFPT